MPQFTLKDLFAMTTWIAVGITVGMWGWRSFEEAFLFSLCAGALIGYGIGVLFHQRLGMALVGAAVAWFLFAFFTYGAAP